MTDYLLIISCGIIGIIIAFLVGFFFAKFSVYLSNRKIQKGALDVLNGKKENKIEIDGQTIEAYKFKVEDIDGKEKTIDLRKLNKEKSD